MTNNTAARVWLAAGSRPEVGVGVLATDFAVVLHTHTGADPAEDTAVNVVVTSGAGTVTRHRGRICRGGSENQIVGVRIRPTSPLKPDDPWELFEPGEPEPQMLAYLERVRINALEFSGSGQQGDGTFPDEPEADVDQQHPLCWLIRRLCR